MNQRLPEGVSAQEMAGLHDAAADWFVRRQQADWTGADERALDAWLAANALHRDIFEGMARPWNAAPQLRQLFPEEFGGAGAELTGTGRPAPRQAVRAGRVRWWARPAMALCTLAAVASLAAGGWYHWDRTPGYTLQARTTPGETRDLLLPDGSRIALNRSSQLQVRYYPRRREVVLDHGEAFFQVAPGADRPFTVDTGTSQVKVVGTAFNMRAGPVLVVKVLEGKVQLRPGRDDAGAEVMLLGAGSGVALDTATGQRRVLAAEPDTVGDWRTGQLRFSGTPLAEVAQELSRYLAEPVVLEDPALGRLLVSGLLATASPERFVRALPGLIPVRVQHSKSGWLIKRGTGQAN
ncbi:MAG: FecR domain-containing protein [Burkholderiaceae bacterium]|jgi:transmembrane sensor|nr:FecR domain-containing protein [Burkholderiaceae bacterium]